MRAGRSRQVSPKFDPKLGVRSPAADLNSATTTACSVRSPNSGVSMISAAACAIRKCQGPDPVYSIVMDVGRHEHRAELRGACSCLAWSCMPRATGRRAGAQPGPHSRHRAPLRMVHPGVVRDLGRARDYLRARERRRRSRTLFRRIARVRGTRWSFRPVGRIA